MRADASAIYDDTLTILNRIDARDAGEKQDVYLKTVLKGCMWSSQGTRSVQSDGTVVIGTVHRVQIPETEAYAPYRELAGMADRAGRFTLRQGDYVVRGEVTEAVDASNAKKVVAAYEPEAFQIQHFRDLTKGKGFSASRSGVMRFAECYYVEG